MISAVIYRAHDGQGKAYIALDSTEDGVEEIVRRNRIAWKMRNGGQLPGLPAGRWGLDNMAFVAEAASVGVPDLVSRFGPVAFAAERGELVWVDWDGK